MKILIIGANGRIGRLITPAFAAETDVVTAGRTGCDIAADIADGGSIREMFAAAGNIDACICVAGDSETADIAEMTGECLAVGIEQKLLGQLNLVLIGQEYLNNGGSFTLTSGKMGDKPVAGSSGKAFVNGAINSFVMAAALDLKRGLRVNAVSPAKIGTVPDEDVIAAYRRSVEGSETGQIFRVY
jgi:NAD(P)-dependent dehydrogenase (short-subunit alcohol dehydrogenase family)